VIRVSVSDDLARRLVALAKRRGTKPSAEIRKALEHWVGQPTHQRPDVVLPWTGDPTIDPFQSFREDSQPKRPTKRPRSVGAGHSRRGDVSELDIRATAGKAIGRIAGGNPKRAERARATVRGRLER
jgi:hypothetical protein